VPLDDSPESWGRRDEWLARIREQRLQEGRNPSTGVHQEQENRLNSLGNVVVVIIAAAVVMKLLGIDWSL